VVIPSTGETHDKSHSPQRSGCARLGIDGGRCTRWRGRGEGPTLAIAASAAASVSGSGSGSTPATANANASADANSDPHAESDAGGSQKMKSSLLAIECAVKLKKVCGKA